HENTAGIVVQNITAAAIFSISIIHERKMRFHYYGKISKSTVPAPDFVKIALRARASQHPQIWCLTSHRS
ncbi:hypothetical protein JS562_46400, partial [Agrobacterium sp. S2]|nr:hypothetical protein [Agrobacterium sp. S2]